MSDRPEFADGCHVRLSLRWNAARKVWTIVASDPEHVVVRQAEATSSVGKEGLVALADAVRDEMECWLDMPIAGMARAHQLAELAEEQQLLGG